MAGYALTGAEGTGSILGSLSSFAEPLLKLPTPLLGAFIFLNNAVKSVLAIAIGPVLGLFPLLLLVSNGIILGLVVARAYDAGGVLLPIVSLAPHGILELLAVALCAGLGLRLGGEAILSALGRPSGFKQSWRLAFKLYLVFALPMLLAASVIEVTITPALMQSYR